MRERVTKAPMEWVPIEVIQVGVRRRRQVGSVKGLAQSIADHGLIHPVLLRGNTLVAGGRRLAAFQLLGRKKILARRVDGLSDEELRALELAENTERQDLLDFETTQERLAQIHQVEAKLKAAAVTQAVAAAVTEAVTGANSARPGPEKPRAHRATGKAKGRKKEAGSTRAVAEATGVPRGTRVRMEEHLVIANRFPFLKRAGWVQANVLEAGALLDQLPEAEHPPIAGLLDQDGVPPRKALVILRNLVTLKTPERRALYDRAASPDPYVRGDALSRAAALPPEPDPGVLLLREGGRLLKRAANQCRVPGGAEQIWALHKTTETLADHLTKEGESYVRP